MKKLLYKIVYVIKLFIFMNWSIVHFFFYLININHIWFLEKTWKFLEKMKIFENFWLFFKVVKILVKKYVFSSCDTIIFIYLFRSINNNNNIFLLNYGQSITSLHFRSFDIVIKSILTMFSLLPLTSPENLIICK